MQIVIDISEDDYRKVQDGRASVSMMRKAIRNGTPLPKGHGILIDANVLTIKLKAWDINANGIPNYAWKCIREMPTIIEADKGESENE